MYQMVEAENVMKISGALHNNLFTLAMLLSVVYILYAMVSISINKKRAIRLQRVKKLITKRHSDIETENAKRRKIREKVVR